MVVASSPDSRRKTPTADTLVFRLGAVRVELTAARAADPAALRRLILLYASFVDPTPARYGREGYRTITYSSTSPRYRLVIGRARGPHLRGCDIHRALHAAAGRVAADGFPEPPRPRALPPEVLADPVRLGAETLDWRAFEETVVADGDVALAWDDGLAGRFNRFLSERVAGCPPKPVVFDFRPGTRAVLGEHCPDRIRVRADIPDPEKWRVLIHELAHYRVGPHRRAFVRELALVYRTWLEFLGQAGTRPPGGA